MTESKPKIPVNGDQLEQTFDAYCGDYATKFSDMEEPYDDYVKRCRETHRTRFRRDKDRILYSKSFRRLQHKTQVIASSFADHQRTRLLHTLEVQQLAGSISDALLANTDLSEAIALGHDLGHTPFGHAGERTLDILLQEQACGGFSHAIQSLRILKVIETHPKENHGLSISNEVLSGILKHDSDIFGNGYSKNQVMQLDCSEFNPTFVGGIESQIVYWSDKLAYLSHDWEDFIRFCYAGLFKHIATPEIKEDIAALCSLWNELGIGEDVIKPDTLNILKTRDIIRTFTTNLIETTKISLTSNSFKSSRDLIEYSNNAYQAKIKDIADSEDAIRSRKTSYQDSLVVNLTQSYRNYFRSIRKFLDKYYIGDPSIIRTDMQGGRIIKELFNFYISNPKALDWDQRVSTIGFEDEVFIYRIIADHISGMTDRYAVNVYNQIMGLRSV